MLKIRLLLPLINFIGAVTTFIYFNFILESEVNLNDIPEYFAPLFFVIANFVIMPPTIFYLRRKSMKTMIEVAEETIEINALEKPEIYHLQREALQFPITVAVTTFIVWIIAGFVFGVLQPLLGSKIFNTQAPDLIYCLRIFLGISLLGGGITTLVSYFIVENVWRQSIPKFFPKGYLSKVKHVFKLNVRKRLLIVFLSITLIPLPIIGATLYSKITALNMADAITRSEIISSLMNELLFLTVDSLAICFILAYFLSKSILKPLLSIKNTIKEVENNNLDTRVEIVSNDELGDVAEGLNSMIQSMQESRDIRESFGKYVSKEIRDEIIAGKTFLEGEMKRATLLFADLRNFTTLVEKNHPRHVVTIMNQYFNEMTIAIKENRGLILQYVGDEIEAVFGAPIDFEDHPDMAVKTAIEMRKRLKVLNEKLVEQGFQPLAHGIGIHSGAVLAGNIGSEERMSYSLIGDTVNTASRIEGLTKEYGCDIIISQTTFNLLTESYDTMQLDRVKVKGKEDKLIIYKLL
jgi:adenylate cyclase